MHKNRDRKKKKKNLKHVLFPLSAGDIIIMCTYAFVCCETTCGVVRVYENNNNTAVYVLYIHNTLICIPRVNYTIVSLVYTVYVMCILCLRLFDGFCKRIKKKRIH